MLPSCLHNTGNGPAALILSYILHGHIPYYIGGHHDPILDSKLSQRPNLLHLTPDLYAHFLASLRYSTQALPVNTLLDTLLRPNADTEINPTSCVEWRYEPEKAISHVAIGQTPQPGGQWAENPVSASADIATLSYAEQLSLPGYTYADHLARNGKQEQCDFVRPSRAEVADYLKAYPNAVGISDSIVTGIKADHVYRIKDGFFIGSLGIQCKHLVLASGTFTVNIPPTPLLEPLAKLDSDKEPLLVIGSGFSAADVIISTPSPRKVIHIYQWAPESRPSPLKGCHHTAYPEYATIYRQMKLAAKGAGKGPRSKSPLMRRKSNPFFCQRDWASVYEGLPNAEVISVDLDEGKGSANVRIRLASGEEVTRTVGGLQYVVGRRGTLDFLSPELRSEILGPNQAPTSLISGRTLRTKVDSSLEVARDVFVIGSLTGDSLIRHAVGGCVFTAGRILKYIPPTYAQLPSPPLTPYSRSQSPVNDDSAPAPPSETATSMTNPNSNSRNSNPDSKQPSLCSTPATSTPATPAIKAMANTSNLNGHEDLHLDRRKLAKAVEVASVENRFWGESGWWSGGGGLARDPVL